MNWFLLPLSPHPHVILHAGLARSCRIHCFKKRRKTFSLGRRCPSGRMRGGGKCSSPALTHRLRRSPLSRRARVIFGMMDSATSPSAPRRMTGWCGVLGRVKVFISEKPTLRESGPLCIGHWLMLCVLALDWYCAYWLLFDAVCIGYCLMLCASVLDWCYVNWFLNDSCLW